MLRELQQFIHTHRLCHTGDHLLVAFSGGRDSVCLAHLLSAAGYRLALAHVNYGLRGAESEEDERFAQDFARQMGAELFVHREMMEKNGNLQARARKVRYDFFHRLCKDLDFDRIATAHHRDDHLETFLVQLLRGASLEALGGIPVRHGKVIRPLLFAQRGAIDAYLRQHELSFREDSSNAQPDYLRNRIRHQLLPLLREIEPGAETNLESVSNRLAGHTEAVFSLAASFLDHGKATVIPKDRLPQTNRAFWLHQAMKSLGFTRTQCENILSASQSGKEVRSATHRLVTHRDRLELAAAKAEAPESLTVNRPGRFSTRDFSLHIRENGGMQHGEDHFHIRVDAQSLAFPLTFRPWEAGDRFQPLGASYAVKVKNYLTDRKTGKLQKERTIVGLSGGAIFWIPGIALSEGVKVTDQTEQTISLEFSYLRE